MNLLEFMCNCIVYISTDVQSVLFICIAFECSDYKNLAKGFLCFAKSCGYLTKGTSKFLVSGHRC